ncbi:MAG TPA: DUF4344 domain-containing metallopeptidase, partial [Pyrinomonadaceae bacterium]|nr:DUF4344 domain-containing metallopeptidase [Pyrinomonadaceae bacterium]
LAVGALVLVAGCFCRSNRDLDGPSDNPPRPTSTLSTSQANKSTTGSTSAKKPDTGDFLVEHLPVTTPRYIEIDKQVRGEKLLENAADDLNKALNLNDDITLRTKDCKEINAYYDPNDSTVTMCYELMEHFYATFKSAGSTDSESYKKMFDAVRFVFLHEIAHALIDKFKLPVIGNEEDAADRCSAYINLEELGDEGVSAVFAAADAFAIESKKNQGKAKNMADEHLLGEQRFYNSLCMIYGSNTSKYEKIVTEGYLPKERAVRCANEYQRTVDSWVNLLGPYRKN